jgi:hypothetical protein
MVTVLEEGLKELCTVRNEVWELTADLMRTAFGTPMFSQRPDAGYPELSDSDSGTPWALPIDPYVR